MKTWKKYTILINSLAVWIIIVSCGPGPYVDETRVQLYHSSINVSKNLYPFFYSPYHLNSFFSEYNEAEYFLPHENLIEWNNYAGGNVQLTEIYKFIYKTPVDKLSDSDNFSKFDNSFVKKLLSDNKEYVLKYITFAKEVEIELNSYKGWLQTFDEIKIDKLIARANRIIYVTDDDFIKQRYSYQVIVMLRYIKKYEEAIKFYEQNFLTTTTDNESLIKYWALSHVAFCKEKMNLDKEAQKDYLTVFYNVDLKKRYAYSMTNLDFIEDFYDELNEEQKYSYLILKQLRNPGQALNYLPAIAQHGTDNQSFILLMNREVNKLDDWILSRQYSNFDSFFQTASDENYLIQFITFTEDILNTSSEKNKPMWQLMLSHLYFLENNPVKAEHFINKIDTTLLVTNELELQYHIEKILVNSIKSGKYTNQRAELLYQDLNYILSDSTYILSESKLLQSVFKSLYHSFKSTNQHDIAAIVLSFKISADFGYNYSWWTFYSPKLYLDRYGNTQQIENFMQIVDNKGTNNFEKLMLKNYEDYNENEFYDLLGTIKFREGDLNEALVYYKKVDTNYYNTSYFTWYLETNPYMNEFITEYEDLLSPNYNQKAYFIETLITKTNKYNAASGKKKGKLALELANAYYNMSYYGNSWYYSSYGWSIHKDNLYYQYYNNEINDNYQTCSTAFEYYDAAIKYSKKLDKALAYFLAASVKTQIDAHNSQFYYYDSLYNNKDNNYFNDFKDNMPKFFDQYFGSCRF